MSTTSSTSSCECSEYSKYFKQLANNNGEKVKKNVLVGCSGSVAALKIPLLTKLLNEEKKYNVKVVTTKRARHFFNVQDIAGTELITDDMEWESWKKRGDPVLHIELAKWADLFVIAPLDANTLSKLANGMCDNLLTSVARAWNFEKPLLFCPAMNTKMYEHPITSEQITRLVSWGYTQIPVITKVLVCGDKGIGAMAEVETIVQVINDSLKKHTNKPAP